MAKLCQSLIPSGTYAVTSSSIVQSQSFNCNRKYLSRFIALVGLPFLNFILSCHSELLANLLEVRVESFASTMRKQNYKPIFNEKEWFRAGAGSIPGLVVMRWDVQSGGHGLESQYRILTEHFSHWFVVKIVLMFVWKRPKINEKRSGLAHF